MLMKVFLQGLFCCSKKYEGFCAGDKHSARIFSVLSERLPEKIT
jgi:hypothetical protein